MGMRETNVVDLRKRIKHYFDVVEGGEVVRVYRNGKPIAEILPVRNPEVLRRSEAQRFKIPGLSLSEEILRDRSESEL
jgi:antitoxin (DNA-binding transcriptional repressor) of toxin-antitoxin stability system